jgi:hypothetical protein
VAVLAVVLVPGEVLIPGGVPVMPRIVEIASGLALLALPFAMAMLLAQSEKEIERVSTRPPPPPETASPPAS